MYTEDDEKIKSNDGNSNSDFYKFFDEKSNKEKKSKKNKEPEPLKDESDYSDYYGIDDEEDNNDIDIYNNSNHKVGKILKIIAFVLLLIILGFLVFILLAKNEEKGDIEIVTKNLSLNVGDKDFITYKIVDTENDVKVSFSSSDINVATVNENGQILAIGNGTAIIRVNYYLNGRENTKEITVTVTGSNPVNQEITLDLTIQNGDENVWTNKDIIINAVANSFFEIDSVQYAINCDSDCNYQTINNNSSITISNSGITKVTVLARDKNNQEITKSVTVKIDKEEPSIEFNYDKNINSTSNIEVCATCTDSLSGCKQNKVCKKYTASSSNQILTVYDNAGNKKNTSSFNVKINKLEQPCSLKVSSSGVVTATLRESAVKYGFDSSFASGNELSKQISVNAYKAGESSAKIVYYYVQNKNGNIGQCYITVIKECTCKDAKSSNCSVSCTYRTN